MLCSGGSVIANAGGQEGTRDPADRCRPGVPSPTHGTLAMNTKESANLINVAC